MQGICVLGATGSIGQNTLDVISRHPERFKVVALTTHTRVERLFEQARACHPDYLVVADETAYRRARELLSQTDLECELLSGPQALEQVAALDEVDTVMAAIVGAAGLMPTLSAVKAGKRVLLANKESLVMSGEIFIQAVNQCGAELLPIDSEHNAIFQCLPAQYQYGNLAASGIRKILLTGSGGPFIHTPISDLERVTPAQACAHPNWDMGRKISVDSATMMNKGLELIEACWLFGLSQQQIQVVLHPQSIIHSMVQYVDGSVLAQMGNPDMRTPIAHCLAHPARIDAGVAPLDFANMADFSFTTADPARYPNLTLAMEACEAGQFATTTLNAANEVAVEAFLQERIGFVDIYRINQQVLDSTPAIAVSSLDDVLMLDKLARERAHQQINRIGA